MAGALASWLVAATLGPAAYGSSSATPTLEKGASAPHKFTTAHFEIEFSVRPQVGRTYAILCERAYRNFLKKFDVPQGEIVWEGKCRVYLFASREEFTRFATTVHNSHAAADSGGYTRITRENPDIVLYLDKNDHARLRQVLVHEMTHVFLQLFHKEAEMPLWLHEGFAQLFEFQSDPAHSRFKDSRGRAKRLVKSGEHKPLSKFSEAKFPGTDLDSYAQAWSLVDFMLTKGSAKRTGKFILVIKDGGSQEDALRQCFNCSLDRFEKLWQHYVLTAY